MTTCDAILTEYEAVASEREEGQACLHDHVKRCASLLAEEQQRLESKRARVRPLLSRFNDEFVCALSPLPVHKADQKCTHAPSKKSIREEDGKRSG